MVQMVSNAPSHQAEMLPGRRRKLRIDTSDGSVPEQAESGRHLSLGVDDLVPGSPLHHPRSPYFTSPSSTLFEWHALPSKGGDERPPKMSGISANFVDDTLYIFGGYHASYPSDGSAQDSLYAYDIHRQSWTKVKTIGVRPSPRTSHSAVTDEVANKLYVFCGSGSHFGSTNHGDVFELDLALHSWRQLRFSGDELTPRYGQSAVLYSDRIFVFGGTSGREFSQDFFCLDLKQMQCRRLPVIGSVPSPRYKHSAGIFDQDKMLIFGGSENHNRYLDEVYAVDLNSLVWIRIECHGAKPGGRFAHGFCIHDDKAFVFGGNEDQGSELFILYIYARTWAKVDCTGSIPRGRLFIGMAIDHVRSTLMVWGGKEASSNPNRVRTLHAMMVDERHDNEDQSSFVDDLIGLLRTGVDSDLHVNAFYATHQLIIRCRCPQLAERIQYNERGPVLDLPYRNAVVEILLYFLYSDDIPEDPIEDVVLLEALVTATDLSLTRLTALCDRRLRRRISLSRAERWLQILNGDDRLSFVHALHVYIESHQGQEIENQDSPPTIPRVQIPGSTIRLDVGRLRAKSWIEADTDSVPFDLRFQCGESDKKLYAHRVIVSARSRYFGSFAFREGMKEGATKFCKFPPAREGVLSLRAFEALLDYLYCDEVIIEETEAKELLAIDVVNFFGLPSKHILKLLEGRFCIDDNDSSTNNSPYDFVRAGPGIRCFLS